MDKVVRLTKSFFIAFMVVFIFSGADNPKDVIKVPIPNYSLMWDAPGVRINHKTNVGWFKEDNYFDRERIWAYSTTQDYQCSAECTLILPCPGNYKFLGQLPDSEARLAEVEITMSNGKKIKLVQGESEEYLDILLRPYLADGNETFFIETPQIHIKITNRIDKNINVKKVVFDSIRIINEEALKVREEKENPVHRVRTKDELLKKWEELKPVFKSKETPYLEFPSGKPPYVAGKLKPEYLKDAINYLNFIRYLVGFPDDLTLNEEYNKFAQHGALLNSCHGELNHFPNPAKGMSSEFYQTAKTGTSMSNLAMGTRSLNDSTDLYMEDIAVNTLGHRNWIMHPRLKEVGFGFVASEGYNFSSLFVIGEQKIDGIDYNYLCWPPAGFFPKRLMTSSTLFTWSVTLNYNKYILTKTNLHLLRVEITKESKNNESERWEINPLTNEDPALHGAYLSTSVSNFELGGGYGNMIAFRPDYIGAFDTSDVFKVKIKGVYTNEKKPAIIEYEFELIDL